MKHYGNHLLRVIVLIIAFLFCFGFSSEAAYDVSFSSQKSPSFYQGINELNHKNYQKAIINFTEVIKKDKQLMAAAYTNRCLAHLQLNHNQDAKKDCIKALTMNADNIEAYLNQGMADYRLGNFSNSLAAYQQVIKRDKNDYRAYYNQGLVYFELQDYQTALNAYNQALNSNKLQDSYQKSLIYYDRSLAYFKQEEFPQAIANLTHAIILDNINDKAYYHRGYAYEKLGNYQAAINDFAEAIALNPQLTVAYLNRGLSKQKLGFLQAAFQDFTIALEQFQQQENLTAYQQTLNLIKQLKRIISQPIVIA
ncbi:MAG: tetratricopeptide repeat protein [Cyanobacteria bacterium P01_G01_bin.49]